MDFYLIVSSTPYQEALFNDMTNIEHVYIIKNRDAEEITNLLNQSNE